MWIFTKYGMLSAVSKSAGIVTVRARSRKHLAVCLVRAFGDVGAERFPLQESPRFNLRAGTLDYRWRVKLHQREWHVLVAALAADVMDYGNFKDAAAGETTGSGNNYHASLNRIWLEMRELQEREMLLEDRLRRAAAYWKNANGDTGTLPNKPQHGVRKAEGKTRAAKTAKLRKEVREIGKAKKKGGK